MKTVYCTLLSSAILFIALIFYSPNAFAYLTYRNDFIMKEICDTIKTNEKKILFIVDGEKTVIEKSIMIKRIDKSTIESLRIINKPTEKDILWYGKEAVNGIIIIQTIKKKETSIKSSEMKK